MASWFSLVIMTKECSAGGFHWLKKWEISKWKGSTTESFIWVYMTDWNSHYVESRTKKWNKHYVGNKPQLRYVNTVCFQKSPKLNYYTLGQISGSIFVSVLSIRLFICLYVCSQTSLVYNFWPMQYTVLAFGKIIPCAKYFQVKTMLCTLCPWPCDLRCPHQGHGVSLTHFVLSISPYTLFPRKMESKLDSDASTSAHVGEIFFQLLQCGYKGFRSW